MMKLIVMFTIFAGIMYYFNIDLRGMVDQSGIPTWLSTHGISPTHNVANVASTTAGLTGTSTQN